MSEAARLAVDRIDTESFVPVYHQLKVILSDRIRQGALRPDDPLPSEHQLAAAFGISRATVRKALGGLQRATVSCTHGGERKIASPSPSWSEPFRFYTLGRGAGAGGLPSPRRCWAGVETPLPADIAERLRRSPGEPSPSSSACASLTASRWRWKNPMSSAKPAALCSALT